MGLYLGQGHRAAAAARHAGLRAWRRVLPQQGGQHAGHEEHCQEADHGQEVALHTAGYS